MHNPKRPCPPVGAAACTVPTANKAVTAEPRPVLKAAADDQSDCADRAAGRVCEPTENHAGGAITNPPGRFARPRGDPLPRGRRVFSHEVLAQLHRSAAPRAAVVPVVVVVVVMMAEGRADLVTGGMTGDRT